LVASGAKVEPDWLVDKRVLADPEMADALNGRMSDANFC